MTRTRLARRLASALASALVCAAAACSEPPEGADIWRFAIEETQGSVQDTYAREFERLVEERTDGTVDVRVFPYGTLGTSNDITEQLRQGPLQFAAASPGHLGTTIPEIQVFLLHFLFDDDEDVNRAALADPAVIEAFDPLYREKGMKLMAVVPEGWMVWTTRREVREPVDFEGIKIRTMTSPLLRAAYEAYGASPQAMPYSEVYSGLQLNMIDAQVNPIFAIEEMSFYEVQSHLVIAKPALFVTTIVSNPDFLASLSPERRALVDEVFEDLEDFAYDVQMRFNRERLEAMLEHKPDLQVVELDAEERAAFRALSMPVRERFVDDVGPSGRVVLDALLGAIERAGQDAADGD